MPEHIFNVLFLCTGNSARSILAESILNEASEKFRAFSAGSRPKGEVHPEAVALLKSLGHETGALRSKSWNEFARAGAPDIDFIFTVCDNAAGETCPVWPGKPVTAHWGIPDPAAVSGSPEQIAFAFQDAYRMLKRRIDAFAALPLNSLDGMTIQSRLREIGQMPGATSPRPDVA